MTPHLSRRPELRCINERTSLFFIQPLLGGRDFALARNTFEQRHPFQSQQIIALFLIQLSPKKSNSGLLLFLSSRHSSLLGMCIWLGVCVQRQQRADNSLSLPLALSLSLLLQATSNIFSGNGQWDNPVVARNSVWANLARGAPSLPLIVQ